MKTKRVFVNARPKTFSFTPSQLEFIDRKVKAGGAKVPTASNYLQQLVEAEMLAESGKDHPGDNPTSAPTPQAEVEKIADRHAASEKKEQPRKRKRPGSSGT